MRQIIIMSILSMIGIPLPIIAQTSIRELRIQRTTHGTYFHVVLEAPPDLRTVHLDRKDFWSKENARLVAKLPQFASQSDNAEAVYPQLKFFPDPEDKRKPHKQREEHVDGLEVVGRLVDVEAAKFVFVYPYWKGEPPPEEKRDKEPWLWKQVNIVIDFNKATKIYPPERPGPRTAEQPLHRDDLQALWAFGQGVRFSYLEFTSHEHSFFGFGRAATSKKYGVPTDHFGVPRIPQGQINRKLYHLATGSAAIAEALQLRRMLGQQGSLQERTIAIAEVSGIEIPEYPWEKMLKGKKSDIEPLARMVPHDHYYAHFQDFGKLVEMLDLVEKWGAPVLWAFEPHHREYQLRRKYESQLCLPSKQVAEILDPALIHGVSVSGSDLYLRDGSDVTVIFHVNDQKQFLKSVAPFLEQARQAHGKHIQESRHKHQGFVIQSMVTPHREVSLYRAEAGDYIIYSNSLIAVKHVLDTRQGWRKSLAQSPDYQYLRTVLPKGNQQDGFAFLSDAFLRQMAGPANRIKHKRRLEAMASLTILTNAALFSAWETNAIPQSREGLLSVAALSANDIHIPGSSSAQWDGNRNLAFDSAYNTLQFATPLIELPIDKITRDELQDYRDFRSEYMSNWRGYFDPIAMSFEIDGSKLRMHTHIVPLIQNNVYRQLRQLTGNGVTKLDPTSFSSKTLVQLKTHISPSADERKQLNAGLKLLGVLDKGSLGRWLGEWSLIRFDDSPVYTELIDYVNRSGGLSRLNDTKRMRHATRLVFQMPITVGIEIRNPLVFTGFLAGLKRTLNSFLPGSISWETIEPKYKGVNLVRVQAIPDGTLYSWFNKGYEEEKHFAPTLYYTLLGDAWYISTSKSSLHDVIDHWRGAKADNKKPTLLPVNGSLYLAPGAAVQAKGFLHKYLEIDVHRRALGNIPLWAVLYRTGLVTNKMSRSERERVAHHYFGFIPESPDASAYAFSSKLGEVTNRRHGSLRDPQQHAVIADESPLAKMVNEIRNLRAEFLFQEDGLETRLVLKRQ